MVEKLFGTEQPAPVRCRQCSELLAEVVPYQNGVQLTFGASAVAVVGGVKLRCLNCGYVTKWHPESAGTVDPPKTSE